MVASYIHVHYTVTSNIMKYKLYIAILTKMLYVTSEVKEALVHRKGNKLTIIY